ncbi:MAG: NAD(P)-dependent oxidoreductase [Patescibacteria group bacterium]
MGLPSVGVIGAGRMGNPMARNLLAAGYAVHVHDLRPEACTGLVSRGAVLCGSPAEVAAAAEIILLSLVHVSAIREVLFGPSGVASVPVAGKVVIDTSTSSPTETRLMAQRLAALGAGMLDAPVTGGVAGAEAGTLNIMAGGDPETYERCLPILQVLGGTVVRVGGSGAGQVAKLANQMMMCGYFAIIAEAFAFVEEMGVDPAKVFQVVETGGARSGLLTGFGRQYVRRAETGEDDPPDEHYTFLYKKDLHLALEEGHATDCHLPVTAAAHELFKQVLGSGIKASFPLNLLELWHLLRGRRK